MAGSAMTFAYHEIGAIHKIVIAWTSDDTTGAVAGTTKIIRGDLLKGVTDPSATAPTADYDIVLTDPEGANLLGNCVDDLIDRHTSNTESVDFIISDGGTGETGARPIVCDAITVTVSAAGNSKLGQLLLYYRPGAGVYGRAG